MNILLISYYGNRSGGGMATYNQCVINNLSAKGHTLYTASAEEYDSKFNYTFFRFRIFPLFYLRDIYLYYFLNRIIRNNKMDIIYCTDSRFCAVSSIKLSNKYKIPLVLHHHDYWFCCLKGDLLYKNNEICEGISFKKCMKCCKKRLILWQLYKYFYFRRKLKLLMSVRNNLCVSNYVNKKLNDFSLKNILTVFSPVDAKEMDNINGAPLLTYLKDKIKNCKVITFIGRFTYHRGIKNLLEISRIIKSKDENIKFLYVGEGELFNFCEKYIRENRLDNVILAGQVDHKCMKIIYDLSDMIIFPSLLPEPFSRMLVEAMANRKVIIASDVGGNKEIIKNNTNGFLLGANDINGYVNKIIEVIYNKASREHISNNAFFESRKYNDKFIVDKIENFLSEAIEDGR